MVNSCKQTDKKVPTVTPNPFEDPRAWRKRINNAVDIAPTVSFTRRGFICALITSRCHIGCEHCMFASNMSEGRSHINTMTPGRVQKLLKLVEDSNTGSLLVSGGGEGFLELKLMYQIIEGSTADVTWIVSSGFWANTMKNAHRIINNCYSAHVRGNDRNPDRETIIRISLDKHHVDRIGNVKDPFGYIRRIIEIFERDYANSPRFSLLLHSLKGEEVLVRSLAGELGALIKDNFNIKYSDAKITDSAMLIRLPSGFEFPVTFAKQLLSDIAVDLSNKELLAKRVNIWETDAYVNEQDLTGLQVHDDGYGNDMLVVYDGRVAGGWQCEMPDVRINVDDHDYSEIMRRTITDPGVLATLEKGQRYRFRVLEEANPKACIRAKAVNIRDYTSPTLLEEDRDKLYYTIRAIQDYRKEGRLKYNKAALTPDIHNIISATPAKLRDWYDESRHDIVVQFRESNDGFCAFELALHDFSINGNYELFMSRVLEAGNYDKRRIGQWNLLLRRVHHKWYNIKSWDSKILSMLKIIVLLLEKNVLNGVNPFEGLSWKSMI